MAEPPKPPHKALGRIDTRRNSPAVEVPNVPRRDTRTEQFDEPPTALGPSAHARPQVPGNVPVPQGAMRSDPHTHGQRATDPGQSSPEFTATFRSMMPPAFKSLDADDGEETRVGATIVGAPAYKLQAQEPQKQAYVTVIAGQRAGEMFQLREDETVIGRGPQSGIHLDSDGVSRKHARIVRQGDDFIVEDLKSTNGTWIDERRITFHKLRDGDRVQIGTEVIVRFNFHDELEAGLQKQLYESAVRDPLTRAYNRKHFAERLRAEIAHAVRHRTHLSLIMFDIDYFKRVNDTLGHPAGDAVLRAISGAIMKVVRVEDVFARVGGEEFALLARGIDGPNAVVFGDRLRRGIERLQIPWEGRAIPVTASFGVSTITELPAPPDGDRLVAIADQRLYMSKQGGRNRVTGPA